MREYKFRGKRIDNNEWVYGSLLIDEIQKSFYITDNKEGRAYKVKPETIGQYTGLHDKNGKDIFEGDIIKLDNENVFMWIEYSEKFAQFVTRCKETYFDNEPLGDWELKNLEVIGNVTDNPELIGGENI